ncbi:MAG: hypothetical protein GXP31_07125 [Kiritimatiellaeota bacterium]|nr:hypothetical protein [Kiritimatiellota bacterium]
MSQKFLIFVTVLAVAALTLLLVLLAVREEQSTKRIIVERDKRIGENVVATFTGGEVTTSELRKFINERTRRSGEHAACDKHSYDHSKCSPDEKCENHPLNSVESYRALLRQLVMDKMVERWIREKGMLSRKQVKHRLKHLVEEINLGALAGEMHADKVKPDKIEMRQYYEEHKDEYKNRPFSEVEEEIEGILVARKQSEFIPKYIEELKANAVIERNYDLIKVPEPTEAEIRAYYDQHSKEYVRAEFLRIQILRIGAEDEKAGRAKAEKALAKLRAGADFEEVARDFADDKTAPIELVERGRKSKRFEERVFRYYAGELTPIFKDGGFFYIVKILEREGKKKKSLPEVLAEVTAAVRRQKEEEKFKYNKYDALFSVHGKRFTVEEFQQEFSELSPEEQRQFASFKAKKNLLDQLIVRQLLMEKAEDKGVEAEKRKEIEELKKRALQQMLHKEEVDEKIEVSEKEARELYEKRKNVLMEPAKAKVSVIRIGTGFSADERKRAREKIEAAQKKLNAGADFAEVAKEYSEDWTATRGGEMDRWIYEGAGHLGEIYEHGFHRYVFALQPGETSDFFEFRNNYWIVKMREHRPSRRQTFEEARPTIEAYIKALKHEERMFELQNELLEKSRLVIRDFVLSRMLQAESTGHEHERALY